MLQSVSIQTSSRAEIFRTCFQTLIKQWVFQSAKSHNLIGNTRSTSGDYQRIFFPPCKERRVACVKAIDTL
jgi:hypothetical protein